MRENDYLSTQGTKTSDNICTPKATCGEWFDGGNTCDGVNKYNSDTSNHIQCDRDTTSCNEDICCTNIRDCLVTEYESSAPNPNEDECVLTPTVCTYLIK